LLIGVGDNQACIDRKAFASDQPRCNARRHNTLEYTAKNITLAEPFAAGARERRGIRDLVLNVQAAEPAIGEVHLNLTAEQPLRTDRKDIPDDEHPDHQFRVNRRPAEGRVIGRQFRVHPRQIQHAGDLAHAVIVRNDLIKAERVKKLTLVPLKTPHHRPPPKRIVSRPRNHPSHTPSTTFATKSARSGCVPAETSLVLP